MVVVVVVVVSVEIIVELRGSHCPCVFDHGLYWVFGHGCRCWLRLFRVCFCVVVFVFVFVCVCFACECVVSLLLVL